MNEETVKIKVQFLGGADTVTGSKAVVSYNGANVMIDCGLFQGIKELRLKNWKPLPVSLDLIDAMILTHAHLDHCGYIPVVARDGFSRQIHCTPPTMDLAEIILLDSAKIQEEEADRANRHGYTKHKPAKPLYTIKDAQASMGRFVPHEYGEWVILNNDMKFRLHNGGHILGSSIVELKVAEKTIVFSGDLGRLKPLILNPPKFIKDADVIVMESTYGDRQHAQDNPKDVLHKVIWDTYAKKGLLMIPSFTVERAQEILYLLMLLKEENKLPSMPIYMDSPMGVSATRILLKYPRWQALSRQECLSLDVVAHLISDADASRAVVSDEAPKIVIAGSGMLTGGRILHYMAHHGDNENNTILISGFQAAGTRGRALIEGCDELKFFGKYHKIKANVVDMHALSAHADQSELIHWLSHVKNKNTKILLNHGEPHQSNALRVKIQDTLGLSARVVHQDEIIPI